MGGLAHTVFTFSGFQNKSCLLAVAVLHPPPTERAPHALWVCGVPPSPTAIEGSAIRFPILGPLKAVTFHLSPITPSFFSGCASAEGVLRAITCDKGVLAQEGGGVAGRPISSIQSKYTGRVLLYHAKQTILASFPPRPFINILLFKGGGRLSGDGGGGDCSLGKGRRGSAAEVVLPTAPFFSRTGLPPPLGSSVGIAAHGPNLPLSVIPACDPEAVRTFLGRLHEAFQREDTEQSGGRAPSVAGLFRRFSPHTCAAKNAGNAKMPKLRVGIRRAEMK